MFPLFDIFVFYNLGLKLEARIIKVPFLKSTKYFVQIPTERNGKDFLEQPDPL